MIDILKEERFFYGLVVRGDLYDIKKLKDAIAKIDGVRILEQKASESKLFLRIKEGK